MDDDNNNNNNNNIRKTNTINELKFTEHDQSMERTISSSSSEQLIPKEKQTGINYFFILISIEAY